MGGYTIFDLKLEGGKTFEETMDIQQNRGVNIKYSAPS